MTARILTLASTSPSRQALLANAGIAFDTVAPEIDEQAVKQAFLADGRDQDVADVAMVLAQAKAMMVSEAHPGETVIGADQVLVCDGKLYSKPASLDEARSNLLELSGRTHALETAVAAARRGEVIWSYREAPQLTMRALTPQFIGRYMAAVGDDALATVGSYKLEGRGVQLFEKIDGDYFAILGLPLLALLDWLRRQDLLEA